MGIRSKFLLILVIFSVVPLLGYYLINQRLFEKFGNEIFQIATVLLLQTTAKELQVASDNYRVNLDREFSVLERHLHRSRDTIEARASQAGISSSEGEHGLRLLLSKQLPFLFEQLRHYRDDVVSLHFCSMDGEIIESYPDPAVSRTMAQPITETLFTDSSEIVWIVGDAAVEEPAEALVVTLGQQVVNENGNSLGIISMSVDIMALLEQVKPVSSWAQYTHSLLLGGGSDQDASSHLPVLAIRSAPHRERWSVARFGFTPPPSYDQEISALLKGQQYGETGYVRIPYKGEPALWAFSGTRIGLGIMNILPEREVLFKIARHPGRLGKWLSLDSLLIVSMVVIFMVIVAAYRSRSMLEPFFQMISAFKRVSSGDFSARLGFQAKDERQMVADAFNSMTEQLEEGIRMRQGLAVAEEVQHNFFPQICSAVNGLDIGVRISYSEETGGDYIDVIEGGDEKVCVVVGDVVGHGIGAALLMATVRALVRGRYEVDTNLASLISSVNERLAADMEDTGRFVTLFILEIDTRTSSISWVRAGHDPAWLLRREKKTLTNLGGPGLILGLDGTFQYKLNEMSGLEPGDTILIGTDGIWETSSPEGEWFGKQRVEQVLQEHSDQSALQLCDRLIEEIDRFRGTQRQEDDVSVAIVKVPV
ncbi:MAG: SpoIIE family protein phosphatase [Desulfofustis sp.]|nr:SpoIIE family protein phosphatase [Desulfofustis sp.]